MQITLTATTESATEKPVVNADGSVTLILPASEANSIDAWDSAVVTGAYEAMRASLAQYASSRSQADAQAHLTTGQSIVPVEQSYRVDGEVGRFTFTTHRVMTGERVVYDTAHRFFPPLGPKEWYKTRGYKDRALFNGATDLSLRKTCDQLARWRHQANSTPTRTLQDAVEAEGRVVQAAIEQKAAVAFEQAGFSSEGQPLPPVEPSAITTCLPGETVEKALSALKRQPGMAARITSDVEAEIRRHPLLYEDPSGTVNISADDVGAKKQKERRPRIEPLDPPPKTASKETPTADVESKRVRHAKAKTAPADDSLKRVHTSVVHIQQGAADYTLCAESMKSALRLTTGFLCHNSLTNRQIRFFTDGQKSIKADIQAQFGGWARSGLILDWKHLEDKCKGLLSMALKGRKIRNEVLESVKSWLWLGLVDRAIAEIKNIAPGKIKDPEQLAKLIGYWERNRGHIPCYALRKELGLRNSSNRVEKQNDLLVSERQKNNGMSWSQVGSSALATLTAVRDNYEVAEWLNKRNVRFTMAA